VLAAHIEDPAGSLRARVADIPQDLDLVVLRCLQKHPDARYSTMAALEAALGACGSAGEWTQADAAAWWTASGRLADRTGPSIADTRQVAAG